MKTEKLVCGWGINDADYAVCPRVNGKTVWCPFYQVWTHMVERCHSEKYQEKKPTYKGCVITLEWKPFMTFRSWMKVQSWQNKQLDKDLFGDKLYSPETCCFIEGWLNSLFLDSGASRGKWPIGVSRHRGKFQAKLNVDGKQIHLGYFDTAQEASSVWRTAKLKHVHNKLKDYPDQRIKQAALNKAERLYGGLYVPSREMPELRSPVVRRTRNADLSLPGDESQVHDS